MERPKLAHRRRAPKYYTSPPADADYRACSCMDSALLNQPLNCCKLLRTISSIGDPIGVHLGKSERPHGRHLTNDTTTLFADDDYRHCNLVVTGQLIQQSNCCNILLMITLIGDLISAQLGRPGVH